MNGQEVGRRSRLFHEQFPKTSKRFAEQIDYVAGSLSDKNIKKLEKLATALRQSFARNRNLTVPISGVKLAL